MILLHGQVSIKTHTQTLISSLHHKWDEVRGTGVEVFPIPELWHRDPQLSRTFQWMLWVILYLPRPWLKEGSPHHDASQQAP